MTTTVGLRLGAIGFYRPVRKQNAGFIMKLLALTIMLMVWTVQLTFWLFKAMWVGAILFANWLNGLSAARHGRHSRA